MKKIIPLFMFLLISCNSIKIIAAQEIKTQKGSGDFIDDNKKTLKLIDIEIDKIKTKFIFDTGSTTSYLIDSTLINSFNDKKFERFGFAKGADKIKIKNRLFVVEFNSTLFESKNKVLSFINIPSSNCSKSKQEFTGILGMDLFFQNKLSMQLDFSNNKICNITNEQIKDLIKKDNYSLIKSKTNFNRIFIFLSIEGKEYKFKLDTGYSGNIIMPYSNKLNFINPNKMELEGSLYQTIGGISNGKEVYYEKMNIGIGDQKVESKIAISSYIKAQNIGIDFIKGFDWIIDYNNNKVYIKSNQNVIDFKFSRKVRYYVKATSNEKLIISVKEKSQKKYSIGEEILSVNNQKITPENICEMQDLLNKTDDWETLNVEVKSN